MLKEIEEIYRKLFKEKGISVKKFEVKKLDEYSAMFIHMPGKVFYYVRWEKNRNILTYGRFIQKDVDEENDELEEKTIVNPDAHKLVDTIAKDYKSFVKERGFLKQMISKIMNETINL